MCTTEPRHQKYKQQKSDKINEAITQSFTLVRSSNVISDDEIYQHEFYAVCYEANGISAKVYFIINILMNVTYAANRNVEN